MGLVSVGVPYVNGIQSYGISRPGPISVEYYWVLARTSAPLDLHVSRHERPLRTIVFLLVNPWGHMLWL